MNVVLQGGLQAPCTVSSEARRIVEVRGDSCCGAAGGCRKQRMRHGCVARMLGKQALPDRVNARLSNAGTASAAAATTAAATAAAVNADAGDCTVCRGWHPRVGVRRRRRRHGDCAERAGRHHARRQPRGGVRPTGRAAAAAANAASSFQVTGLCLAAAVRRCGSRALHLEENACEMLSGHPSLV